MKAALVILGSGAAFLLFWHIFVTYGSATLVGYVLFATTILCLSTALRK